LLNVIIHFLCLGDKSSTEAALSSLFIVLKDHDNISLNTKQAVSQTRIIKSAAENDGFEMNHVELKQKNRRSAALWMSSRMGGRVSIELKAGIEKISHLIELRVVDQTGQGKNQQVIYNLIHLFLFEVLSI